MHIYCTHPQTKLDIIESVVFNFKKIWVEIGQGNLAIDLNQRYYLRIYKRKNTRERTLQ